MLWFDPNFDYNDQLARRYMKYNGEYYDVGTICKIKGHYGPVSVRFLGWEYDGRWCFEAIDQGRSYELYNTYNFAGVMDYCLEIVTPVYPNLQSIQTKSGDDREKPPSWKVEVAWIWYIVIMIVAVIFKDRWLIWLFTTAIFFSWKSGSLNNKKK